MPIHDVRELIVKSDFELVAKARRRGGEKAAAKVIAAIARRASATRVERNARHTAELEDDVDRCWPPPMLRKLR